MSPEAWKARLCRKARFKKMRVEGTLRTNMFMDNSLIRTHFRTFVFLLSPLNYPKMRKWGCPHQKLINQCDGCIIVTTVLALRGQARWEGAATSRAGPQRGVESRQGQRHTKRPWNQERSGPQGVFYQAWVIDNVLNGIMLIPFETIWSSSIDLIETNCI